MKKACSILLVLSLVLMVAACGSSPAQSAAGPANMPEWINDFPPEDVIWGIGVAKQSSLSMSMQTAEERARVAIARQLSSKVQAMFTDYNLDAGNAGSQANVSLQENVSRSITNMDVSGVRPIKRYTAPDQTVWVLAEFSKNAARNTVASALGNEEAAFAQFKTQQALAMLDAQLAKEEKPVQYSGE